MSADKISDEDVELVARAFRDEAKHYPSTEDDVEDRCGPHEHLCLEGHIHNYYERDAVIQVAVGSPQRFAEVALATLAGRLLPAGSTEVPERTDWAVVIEDPSYPGTYEPWGNFTTRARAEKGLEELLGDGHNGLIRMRRVWVGPWVNVEEGS